ncbi:MAG: ABC transporter ATP-binding protein [Bacteroidetes bacterium]|nr:ABC transporter ATP-binding protein [Bacteroidota bacterium]MBS1933785.1 ABC transporter ATP-binding protein [Bacteroidota bacterium]
MLPVVTINHLSKNFGAIKAVDDLSFSVNSGDIYGFLGQNGAGKSTTIRMMLTLIEPSGGDIEIFGLKLKSHRKEILRQVGAVIERPDLYKYLTAYENISLFSKMSGINIPKKKIMEQLEQVGIAERAHSKVATYSLGMKQRLGIAIALVNDPQLVILDEPTNGLDPQGIADIRNLILELSRHQKRTILVSSHLLSEIELIANRMLIIDNGKKIIEGNVSDLFDPSNMIVELRTMNTSHTLNVIHASSWKNNLEKQQQDVFFFKMDKKEIPVFTNQLVQNGVEVLSVQPRHSLEDYFLSLTSANQHVETFTN